MIINLFSKSFFTYKGCVIVDPNRSDFIDYYTIKNDIIDSFDNNNKLFYYLLDLIIEKNQEKKVSFRFFLTESVHSLYRILDAYFSFFDMRRHDMIINAFRIHNQKYDRLLKLGNIIEEDYSDRVYQALMAHEYGHYHDKVDYHLSYAEILEYIPSEFFVYDYKTFKSQIKELTEETETDILDRKIKYFIYYDFVYFITHLTKSLFILGKYDKFVKGFVELINNQYIFNQEDKLNEDNIDIYSFILIPDYIKAYKEYKYSFDDYTIDNGQNIYQDLQKARLRIRNYLINQLLDIPNFYYLLPKDAIIAIIDAYLEIGVYYRRDYMSVITPKGYSDLGLFKYNQDLVDVINKIGYSILERTVSKF